MANKTVSIIQSGTNGYQTPAESFNRLATAMFTPGIAGNYTNTSAVAPMTGAFAVNAQGTPNMTIAVTGGYGVINATPSGSVAQNFLVYADAVENVTIPNNASGSTVYDFLYIKLDTTKLNTPAVTGTDVMTYVTQRSTTQTVDSNGALASALLIAVITVTNGATTIVNGNITDYRPTSTLAGQGGWRSANESWTYASATTITVPTGAATRYAVGDRIRIFQSTVKYFVVTAVADTVLTITGGTDYTLTNAAISLPYFSHEATPVGFPQWFNYTPTVTAATGTYTTASATSRFSITGRIVTYVPTVTITTIGTGTNPQITLPVTSANSNGYVLTGREDATSGAIVEAKLASTTVVAFAKYDNTNPVISGSIIRASGSYEI